MRRFLPAVALVVLTLSAACAGGTAPSVQPVRGDRNVIANEEIQATGLATAHEVVQSLRPQWLRQRGKQSLKEDPQGHVTGKGTFVVTDPGRTTLLVYLDNARLGGAETLRQIPVVDVAELRYFDPAAATYRWGAGHGYGVILVSSRPSL